jgi:hypothetical protein
MMKIFLVDTYYAAFLERLYSEQPGLKAAPYDQQKLALLDSCFGTSDFYSRHLRALGWDADDFIVNCRPLQSAWANENGAPYSELALKVPPRFFRLPVIGKKLASLPGLIEVAAAQIRAVRPDVLYCQDLSFFPPAALKALRPYVGMIVGQIACPTPPDEFLKGYDLILTSFPHFVPRFRAMGIASEYFRIGFDPKASEKIGLVEKDISVSFVGGISRHHGKALPLLETLAERTPIEFFGYGAENLSAQSPVRARHHGEVWGLDMYRALARSRITINRHINVAENNANNMRLYEATGMGALLITDMKDNLGDLFEIGKEIIAYSSPDECVELINYYVAHPEEAATIAKAGQQRTLRDHTYRARMVELSDILQRHVGERKNGTT